MIRACQKLTIHMTEIKSPFFEEAFFVLRRDMPKSGSGETLAAEADRIASECTASFKVKSKICVMEYVKKILIFLAGSGVTALVWFIADAIGRGGAF